jgi:CBS domain-containing protein
MAAMKCPYCGYENIQGADHCDKCLHSFMQKDVPQPGKEKLQKKIMTEKVSDFSKTPPILVSPSATLQQVVDEMQSHPTKGCVLIVDKTGKLVGILSIRDILLRVAGLVKDLSSVTVEKVMTPKPECLPKDAPLSFALNKMSIGKFRHVSVLDGEKPIGVVSTRDLIEYLSTGPKK